MRIFSRLALALAVVLQAWPALAQVTVTAPNTVNPSGSPTTVGKTFIVNPDGTIAVSSSAINSTTSGQTGPLVQCAVTTAAPTYATAKTNPLSCTTSGGVRVDPGTVTVATHAVTQSGSWSFSVGAPSGAWQYAAPSGGISNSTTAVTVQATAGPAVRNYVDALQCSADALGAATEVALRDGAAGTVIYRMKVTTAGLSGANVVFPVALKGTADTLLENSHLDGHNNGWRILQSAGPHGRLRSRNGLY